jgi:predicted patatin/cPLA2 family phospholipase
MTIKHLVISGGGPTIIQALACIVECVSCEFLNINDIECMYGTSAGAILTTMLCLKMDLDMLTDYILLRPWEDVFPIQLKTFINAFYSKGLFNTKTIIECFKPLFNAKNIDLNVTLIEFYNICGIEQHFYAFDVNAFESTDFSYKTHPNISMMTVLHMTCAIPILFSPICFGSKCFVDGGVQINYPIGPCITSVLLENESEILGIRNQYVNDEQGEKLYSDYENLHLKIDETSNIFDYGINTLIKLINNFGKSTAPINSNIQITNEIICKTPHPSIHYYRQAISSSTMRKNIFDVGTQCAKKLLEENGNITS